MHSKIFTHTCHVIWTYQYHRSDSTKGPANIDAADNGHATELLSAMGRFLNTQELLELMLQHLPIGHLILRAPWVCTRWRDTIETVLDLKFQRVCPTILQRRALHRETDTPHMRRRRAYQRRLYPLVRIRERKGMKSPSQSLRAMDRFLQNDGLFEAMLLCLPTRDLLMRIPLVSKRWAKLSLLLFYPKASPEDDSRQGNATMLA